MTMPSMSSSSSSSPSSVCQGIQSFVEPRQHHPSKNKPEIHKWVRASCTHHDPVIVEKGNKKEMDSGKGGAEGGWSSIYSLSNPSQTLLNDIGKSYSATKCSSPLPATSFTKRSTFGKKNLAMCTETLGSETGTVYTDDDFPGDAENHGRQAGAMVEKRSNRGSVRAGFPPPLTTWSGESRLRILSKRENGRLLLLPVKPSVIEAERTDGRLRLRLYSDKPLNFRDKKPEALEKEEGEEKEKEEVTKDKSDEEMEEEEEEEEGDYLGVVGMEMNEMSYNSVNGGEEMGIGKYRRPGGCKEEEGGGRRRGTSRGKPILGWEAEAFWVATS